MKSYQEETQKAVEQGLGDKTKDMWEIMALGTTPARQGRGYASALVRVITDQVRQPVFLRRTTSLIISTTG